MQESASEKPSIVRVEKPSSVAKSPRSSAVIAKALSPQYISVKGAFEHNLKGIDLDIERGSLTVVTGVSGSGKSSLAFDTILAEAQRRFFYTLSHYSRQFLNLGSRPAVRSLSGLSPAIALAQNETLPSRRSTVGTLTDISELVGVCFARFGQKNCRNHDLATSALSQSDLADLMLSKYPDTNVAICAPVAEKKKGNFATKLAGIATRGYSRVYIDGKVLNLTPVPQLGREMKHTIKVIIDVVKCNEKNRLRIERSLGTAFEEGGGYAEFFSAPSIDSLDVSDANSYSKDGGCPTCGFSWPTLDSRYFSANSLGRCEECDGYGTVSEFEDDEYSYEFEYEDVEDLGRLDSEALVCPACEGTGLDPSLKTIRLAGKSALDCQKMTLFTLNEFFTSLSDETKNPLLAKNPAFMRVADQIRSTLQRTIDVGLDYLQVCRRIRSLSGGELQRLKLAGILGESLRGVLYVLDEPSQGLHPAEINRLCDTLVHLKNLGNTILVVDHDETLMRRADWIIDLGPGGGARGGNLMAMFRPWLASDFVSQSVTASHLANAKKASQKSLLNLSHKKTEEHWLSIRNPVLHNLKCSEVYFAKNAVNIVAGVSGAGKSSLVLAVLYENARSFFEAKKKAKGKNPKRKFRFCSDIDGLEGMSTVALIDRRPVAKSSVSMPATYLDVFGPLRELYANLPEAQVAGLDASSLSLAREGGRCEACGGRGEINLKMRFLSDARVRCDVCQGKRYRPHILDLRFNGFSLSDVLNLTIDQALEHFKNFRKIQKMLQPASELGLGYLKMGQPSSSLSGGEAQRLKIVPYLAKKHNSESLIILDEPTTGLHFQDVEKLLKCLRSLVDGGATIVMIEHNLDVLCSADWLVELGPGPAEKGGQLIFQGPPSKLKEHQTPTAEFL